MSKQSESKKNGKSPGTTKRDPTIAAALITLVGVIATAIFASPVLTAVIQEILSPSQTPTQASVLVLATGTPTTRLATTSEFSPPAPSPVFPPESTPLAISIPYFNIYTDAAASDNHFEPTGKMGDIDDIEEINDASIENPYSGASAIKIVYHARGQGVHFCPEGIESKMVCRWAGVYWQYPPNNWGQVSPDKAGFNLTGFRKLSFCARSDRDSSGAVIQFQVGGIGWTASTPPPFPDSQLSPKKSGWLTLSSEWECHKIELDDADLSYVIGGFAWVAKWDNNEIKLASPKRIVFYLDEIRFER